MFFGKGGGGITTFFLLFWGRGGKEGREVKGEK